MQLLLCSAVPPHALKQQITTENRLDYIQRIVTETEYLPHCVPHDSHLPAQMTDSLQYEAHFNYMKFSRPAMILSLSVSF